MKAFLAGLLNAVLNSAAQGVVAAEQNGADIKTTGVAAGAAGLAGTLGYTIQFILAHPLGQHPAVPAAVAATQTAVTPASGA